eukprot:scaffold7870_cov80-Skeletonema_marinoi.AAC.1
MWIPAQRTKVISTQRPRYAFSALADILSYIVLYVPLRPAGALLREGCAASYLACSMSTGLLLMESLQLRLVDSFRRLLRKRDAHGRTLLHYITAYNAFNNDLDEPGKIHVILSALKEEYERREWAFPFTFPTDGGETLGNEMIIWQKRHQNKRRRKLEDPTLADYVDSDGLNPFQYAVSVGKKWIDDLDVGTKLGPGWTHVGVPNVDMILYLEIESNVNESVKQLDSVRAAQLE